MFTPSDADLGRCATCGRVAWDRHEMDALCGACGKPFGVHATGHGCPFRPAAARAQTPDEGTHP